MSKLKTKKYNAVANAEKDASQTFVKGAAILTLSMVIVKVFGLLDKVVEIGGTYLENFEFVKATIERYYKGI